MGRSRELRGSYGTWFTRITTAREVGNGGRVGVYYGGRWSRRAPEYIWAQAGWGIVERSGAQLWIEGT